MLFLLPFAGAGVAIDSRMMSGAAETETVTCVVVGIEPVRRGRLLALARVEIEIASVGFEIVARIMRHVGQLSVEGPTLGDGRPAVVLPPELLRPIGRAVLAAWREHRE